MQLTAEVKPSAAYLQNEIKGKNLGLPIKTITILCVHLCSGSIIQFPYKYLKLSDSRRTKAYIHILFPNFTSTLQYFFLSISFLSVIPLPFLNSFPFISTFLINPIYFII